MSNKLNSNIFFLKLREMSMISFFVACSWMMKGRATIFSIKTFESAVGGQKYSGNNSFLLIQLACQSVPTTMNWDDPK